jgi:hypothetical protein
MKERAALCCSDDSAGWGRLNCRQRRVRLIVGVVLLSLALSIPWSTAGWIALAVVAGWLGATHVLAAEMANPSCPELGAAPGLLLGRWLRIGCIPWQWLDAVLRLTRERRVS